MICLLDLAQLEINLGVGGQQNKEQWNAMQPKNKKCRKKASGSSLR